MWCKYTYCNVCKTKTPLHRLQNFICSIAFQALAMFTFKCCKNNCCFFFLSIDLLIFISYILDFYLIQMSKQKQFYIYGGTMLFISPNNQEAKKDRDQQLFVTCHHQNAQIHVSFENVKEIIKANIFISYDYDYHKLFQLWQSIQIENAKNNWNKQQFWMPLAILNDLQCRRYTYIIWYSIRYWSCHFTFLIPYTLLCINKYILLHTVTPA